jgi:hypothetical protein
MAQTLAAHRSGLLAYDDVMISRGPMEGTNNKVKTMKRHQPRDSGVAASGLTFLFFGPMYHVLKGARYVYRELRG